MFRKFLVTTNQFIIDWVFDLGMITLLLIMLS